MNANRLRPSGWNEPGSVEFNRARKRRRLWKRYADTYPPSLLAPVFNCDGTSSNFGIWWPRTCAEHRPPSIRHFVPRFRTYQTLPSPFYWRRYDPRCFLIPFSSWGRRKLTSRWTTGPQISDSRRILIDGLRDEVVWG